LDVVDDINIALVNRNFRLAASHISEK
jgi:hypothetical protein